jgi:hypothetical protein
MIGGILEAKSSPVSWTMGVSYYLLHQRSSICEQMAVVDHLRQFCICTTFVVIRKRPLVSSCTGKDLPTREQSVKSHLSYHGFCLTRPS